MDNMRKEKANKDENSITHVLETWVVASKSQHETQETESGREAKIEANANSNVESEMAMDESTAGGCVETFPTLDLETWAVASESQHETQETESGGEAKIEAKANNNVDGKMAMDEKTVIDGAKVLPKIVNSRKVI